MLYTQCNFIELPKFNKEPTELRSIIEQWVYFIKNAQGLEVIPEDVTDEGLKSAYLGAEQHNWTQAELEAYTMSMREQDDRGRITYAVREAGREKEEELTKEFRREEEENAAKMVSLAKNLLKQGFSIEDTAKATGLTVEEVRKWKGQK